MYKRYNRDTAHVGVTAWRIIPPLGPLLAAALVVRAPVALAEPPASSPSAAKLAQDFSDPLTTFPQVSLQDAYTPANYGPLPRPTGSLPA